jgi:uncharacterized protein (TIGR02246 family)
MTTTARDSDTSIVEHIIALERQRSAALVSRDLDAFEAMLADDCVYIHASGKLDGKASYLAAQRSGTNQFLKFEYEDLRVRVYRPVVAILTGRMRNWVATGGETKMNDHRIQIVWVRSSGDADDWKFASYGASAIVGNR